MILASKGKAPLQLRLYVHLFLLGLACFGVGAVHSNDDFVFANPVKKCPKHWREMSRAEVSPHTHSPD